MCPISRIDSPPDCLKCIENFYEEEATLTCQCNIFVLLKIECHSNCLECQEKSGLYSCLSCEEFFNWELKDGKCICKLGFRDIG